MQTQALVSDRDRAAKLRLWLDTYHEMLALNSEARVSDCDKAVGIHEDTRRLWFKQDFGQQVLAEYYQDLDAYSKTRLALARHRWLGNMIKIAVGEEKTARPMAQIQAATLLENVYKEARERQEGEDGSAGKLVAVLALYRNETTRQGEVVDATEVKVLGPSPTPS